MTATIEEARRVSRLTEEFYRREAGGFSATRQRPWAGWNRALEVLETADPTFTRRSLEVLDIGCGNLRFERFLGERLDGPLRIWAVDNCPELMELGRKELEATAPQFTDGNAEPPESDEDEARHGSSQPADDRTGRRSAIALIQHNVVEDLLQGKYPIPAAIPRSCDLAVAFGFMHHLPRFEDRVTLLDALLSSVAEGGFAVVSLWRFMEDDRIAAKALKTTAEAQSLHRLAHLDDHDYLLGWQQDKTVFRFCHYCDDREIERMLAALSTPYREVASFDADGKSGSLNRYVVLRRAAATG